MPNCFTKEKGNALPIHLIAMNQFETWQAKQSVFVKQWLEAIQFKVESGAVSLLPNKEGGILGAICIISSKDIWSVSHLPYTLPPGSYFFEEQDSDEEILAIGFGLGAYQFNRYKKPTQKNASLFLNETALKKVLPILQALYFVRDCINTPADDMGPSELSLVAEKLAKENGAQFKAIVGEDLLKENYPAIYTVGRASDDAPRLLDLRWGQKNHPKITLVGKGVCFDTGGLDLKIPAAMQLMKKDMSGAAHVLGLAQMIMQANLPICLRVLIPAVENAISGNAYRPGDIIKSRKGLTIEIGNTDAEGRLILADALTEAVSEKPDLIIDISTLTGAARIALGTELAAFFSNSDQVANDLMKKAEEENDPMWRLPLFASYRDSLKSPIADLNNCPLDSYGGAITAALFLKEFVPNEVPWVHFDIMAWNLVTRPGRPQGGEAMTLRALFNYIKTYSSKAKMPTS